MRTPNAFTDLRPTLRLFLFIMGVVFLCEATVMFVLPALLPYENNTMVEALVDASLLSVMSSIIILPLMLRLRRRAENVEQAINITDDGYWVVNSKGRFLEVNDGYCRMIGYSREELLKMQISDVEAIEDSALVRSHIESIMRNHQDRFETRHRHKSGRLIEIEVSVVRVGADTMVVFLRDITDRKRAASEIHNLAFYDTLTGLPNRRLLIDRLEQVLARSRQHNCYNAVMFLDLDNFKTLNDTRGHSQGDRLLMEVANRLKGTLRRDDTVARHGGDEFVIIVENLCQQLEHATDISQALAKKIINALNRPFMLDELEFQTSLSVGITLFQGDDVNVDELLRQADTAMYEAKKSAHSRLAFFQPAMQHALVKRTTLESDLRNALSRGELELYYQPQVDASDEITSAEVLLRWRHPVRGMISPAEFIPVAEDTGLILPIGMWVLENACKTLKYWGQDPMLEKVQLSVNVSAHQFRQPDFVDSLSNLLSTCGACASKLKLELTESAVQENITESIEKIRLLQGQGLGFAMDDFGTGHSSLTNLKRLPIDQLKIDQSFVRDLSFNASDRTIVRTIIVMAESLGLEVIAEGVETPEQRKLLYAFGCEAYQGYLYGPPMPLTDFENMAKQQGGATAQAI